MGTSSTGSDLGSLSDSGVIRKWANRRLLLINIKSVISDFDHVPPSHNTAIGLS